MTRCTEAPARAPRDSSPRPRAFAALGILLLAAFALASGSAAAAGRASSTRVALADCVGKLEAQGGGWCEMSAASIAQVFPRNLSEAQRGWTGPTSVLTAWNGAARDERRRKRYFHDGGHSDYGGNKVNEFNLDSATFTRLNDPAPIPQQTPAAKCPEPASGPRSQHTYDGFFFATAADTLWLLPGATGYCLGGMVNLGGQVWEFNPDAGRPRNGVPPLSWRRHPAEMPAPLQGSFPRTAELPDGSIVVWSNNRGPDFNPATGEWKLLGTRPDWGTGNATPTGEPQKVSDAVFGVSNGAGIAIDDFRDLYVWSGFPAVSRFRPDVGRWEAAISNSGPEHRAVYSKWIYLPREKVFLGYSGAATGVWVYQPPKNGWQDLQSRTAQSYVDAAAEGSAISIPPGLYRDGIRIDKDLTVDLAGVRFQQSVAGKAHVLVMNPKRRIKVVITGYDMPGPMTGDNGAAIRSDYDYDLTVRNFRVSRSNMGILTGNRGGRLVLEDGVVEEACCGSDLSHGVYMGIGDELIMRRVTVTNLRGLGHLVKSRAARTVIEDCRLVGGEGRYSRELDAPLGGVIVMRRNLIEKGRNTDNADSIAVGAEVKPGTSLHPTSFEFTQNAVVFDRRRERSEPARYAGANEFGKWRNVPAGAPVRISGNTFVNMQSWGEFADHSRENRMFATREEAGPRLGSTNDAAARGTATATRGCSPTAAC